jgi:hypothetical protein
VRRRILVGVALAMVVGVVALVGSTALAVGSSGARSDNCVRPYRYVTSGWFTGTVCVTQEYGCTDVRQEAPAPRWRHCPPDLPRWHRGVDLALNCGTQLHTPVTVTDVWIGEDRKRNNRDSGFGPYYPRLLLPDGASVVLAHAERTLVRQHPAAPLPPGTLIALSGGEPGTGSTTGCHLHFELDKPSGPQGVLTDVNPMPYLAAIPITGAVGTWNDRHFGVIGTSVLLDTSGHDSISQEPINGYVINGPAGWNGGRLISFGRHQPPDTAPSRTIYWSFAQPRSGLYSLSGNQDTARGTARGSQSSTLGAPQITHVAVTSAAGRQTIMVTWKTPEEARSYLLRVNRSPWPGSSDGERVVIVPPNRTLAEAVIGNLSLKIGSHYQIVVWAFSDNIKTPGPIATPFNIASDSRRFQYNGPGLLHQLPPVPHPRTPAVGGPVGDLPSP